jgi:UPF0716 protein FxsA
MLVRLLLIFVTVPLIELYLLLQLADITSVPITIGVVIITGLLGAFLAKQQGWMAVWRFRQALLQGRLPTTEIADTVLIVFAAGLLLTPGLLTDALGFALLIPTSRRQIRKWLIRRVGGRLQIRGWSRTSGPQGNAQESRGQTVEGTFRRSEPSRQNIADE